MNTSEKIMNEFQILVPTTSRKNGSHMLFCFFFSLNQKIH